VSGEEEVPGVSEEEEEPPVGVDEEEPPSTSPPSHSREEELCSGCWSIPPPAYAREEERCNSGWSFPPRGVREEELSHSREKQISRSGLGPASSRALSAC
jgi:hypothetical protein